MGRVRSSQARLVMAALATPLLASASKVAVETLELAHEGFLDDEKK